MKHITGRVNLGDGSTLHRFVWIDDPSPEGLQMTHRRYLFLKELVDQDLLRCGPQGFDNLRMRRQGDSWVVEMESREEPEQ